MDDETEAPLDQLEATDDGGDEPTLGDAITSIGQVCYCGTL
jgi:hypothetical protein